jgi:hypothetical protein
MQTIREVLGWIGWPLVFLTLTWATTAQSNEVCSGKKNSPTKCWHFLATTEGALSKSTDQLNGEYVVVAAAAGLEVYQVLNGQRLAVGPRSEAELKRMVALGQDERGYLAFTPEKTWEATYKYSLPGFDGSYMWRTVTYRVVNEKEVLKPTGTFKVISVVGESTLVTYDAAFKQKWVYRYNEELKAIEDFHYDSAVERAGAKITIRLINSGSLP